MSTPAKRRTIISPSATALALTSTPTSSTNPVETAFSLPYFLPELIPLVAGRLTSLQDFFALRAACRTYRDLLPPSPSNLASQAPLLLVPHKASASEALFHAPLRRLLRFRLPSTRRDPSLTSFYSFGCRVAIHDRCAGGSHGQLHICHLLTGERARLPDLPKYIDGVIFSGDLVLIFTQRCRVIYYCRIGDASWQAARCDDERYLLCSLMFVKGTLYAMIYPNKRLAVVELRNSSVELLFLGDETSAQSVQDQTLLCLAECHDELLLVVRMLYSQQPYHVFRWQSAERKWERTTSLGGCSLFFNRYQFVGCLGTDHPAVQKDCIYFTGYARRWGEYSLADGSWHQQVAEYPGQAATEDYSKLTWVLPSIG
uniref:Uncharacterized protein n=1 Tax=Avena sativa TaxID=4498 RepID=A0ACD5XGW1_AVESA